MPSIGCQGAIDVSQCPLTSQQDVEMIVQCVALQLQDGILASGPVHDGTAIQKIAPPHQVVQIKLLRKHPVESSHRFPGIAYDDCIGVDRHAILILLEKAYLLCKLSW